MGAQHAKPDMELMTIMTNIMVAECFQAIKYQVLAGNPHRQTIAMAPLLGQPMLQAQNPFQIAVAAGFQQLGIVFNPADVAFQLQPAMTWETFSQSIQDHMTLDPKHGIHSALSIRSQPSVNTASLANSSTSSSSSLSLFSSHDSFPEPKRQHREPDSTAYAANATPSYEELQTKVAEYERQTKPYDGGYQYPPQHQPQQPNYQQIQQYWQQGAQFPPRHDSYAPRGGAAGGRSQQPAHDGYQQQQQQQGHGGYNRDNQQQLQRGRGRRPNLGRRNHYLARVNGAAIYLNDHEYEQSYNKTYPEDDEWEPDPGSI
jgi:hypothetical protein